MLPTTFLIGGVSDVFFYFIGSISQDCIAAIIIEFWLLVGVWGVMGLVLGMVHISWEARIIGIVGALIFFTSISYFTTNNFDYVFPFAISYPVALLAGTLIARFFPDMPSMRRGMTLIVFSIAMAGIPLTVYGVFSSIFSVTAAIEKCSYSNSSRGDYSCYTDLIDKSKLGDSLTIEDCEKLKVGGYSSRNNCHITATIIQAKKLYNEGNTTEAVAICQKLELKVFGQKSCMNRLGNTLKNKSGYEIDGVLPF